MMLSAEEYPVRVAQQMGHKDGELIRKIYGKWFPDAAPEAGSKAVAMFGRGNYLEKTDQKADQTTKKGA